MVSSLVNEISNAALHQGVTTTSTIRHHNPFLGSSKSQPESDQDLGDNAVRRERLVHFAHDDPIRGKTKTKKEKSKSLGDLAGLVKEVERINMKQV